MTPPRMIEDSVTNKVLVPTTVPVQIIAGDAISRWERYGIPAGLGTAVALFLLAANWRELQWPSARYDRGADDALAKLTA